MTVGVVIESAGGATGCVGAGLLTGVARLPDDKFDAVDSEAAGRDVSNEVGSGCEIVGRWRASIVVLTGGTEDSGVVVVEAVAAAGGVHTLAV
jgi:hypothetical protein